MQLRCIQCMYFRFIGRHLNFCFRSHCKYRKQRHSNPALWKHAWRLFCRYVLYRLRCNHHPRFSSPNSLPADLRDPGLTLWTFRHSRHCSIPLVIYLLLPIWQLFLHCLNLAAFVTIFKKPNLVSVPVCRPPSWIYNSLHHTIWRIAVWIYLFNC